MGEIGRQRIADCRVLLLEYVLPDERCMAVEGFVKMFHVGIFFWQRAELGAYSSPEFS